MIKKNPTTLLLSQLLMVGGLLMAGIGLVGALAQNGDWLYVGAAGVVLALLGLQVLRREARLWRGKQGAGKTLATRGVPGLVLQNNVTKLVTGLALAVSGMLMNGVGLIAGFASDPGWFYLCLIGLGALASGIWLMQGEIRNIIRTLRGTPGSV